jgi:hypothetical protein
MLAKEVGNSAAGVILGIGLAGVALRGWIPRLSERHSWRLSLIAIVFWTVVLIASIGPLALGQYALRPRGLFEVHTVAVAAVALIAWQHRFDARALHALRFTVPACMLVAGLWQAGFLDARFDGVWLARLTVYLPPVLAVVGLARTTRWPG